VWGNHYFRLEKSPGERERIIEKTYTKSFCFPGGLSFVRRWWQKNSFYLLGLSSDGARPAEVKKRRELGLEKEFCGLGRGLEPKRGNFL